MGEGSQDGLFAENGRTISLEESQLQQVRLWQVTFSIFYHRMYLGQGKCSTTFIELLMQFVPVFGC